MRIAWAWMLIFVGCAASAQYGSFVQDKPEVQAAIGTDAAAKLATAYPPESYKVRITQDIEDAFGRGFTSALREHGYAVQTGVTGVTTQAEGELVVQYALDTIKGTELLRVTLYVQRRRLSRAYTERPDGVYPAGPWSVQEPVGKL